jgi:cyclopropane fatty-acyl-phospholipid synthase-like methyltransferase
VNRESYNRIAAEWDRSRATFFGPERDYVDLLLDGLAAGSPVLDLGCGTGRPIAEYVLARGYAVTGVDQASSLLDLARAHFPQATWIESRIEEVRLLEDHYAAAVCWDALFHIERARHARIIEKIAASLRPGGKVMLTVGGSDHPPFTDSMFGQEFFYDSHPPEAELALVERAGFEPLVAKFINPPTTGRDKGRYAIVARLAG